METEEVIKLVDGIYKNILEKFNPGARQLISAGKAYLKALHGAASASRLFNEALAKIAVNAQQGGTTDIGSALMSIVGVYKEIQDQHMNILKAFYVDLLVPLETNLEKDTKVVQYEQKRFLQQHKIRADSYSKATATMKKQRKKKTNSQSAEKEIKSIQAMEEEKNKLDSFCEQSLKNAMTQERRRYGFVLERQCSLAKHWMAYHAAGRKEIENSIDNWNDVAASREFLPPNVESMFKKKMYDMSEDDSASERGSISSQLRKTRSIDASCMDMRSIGDVVNNSMNRAKSEYNLTSNTNLITPTTTNHSEINHWDQRPIARALYAYLSSGENQLSFLEGDRIALVGERAKGWQFGENLRTQMFGWFPLAYTESEHDENNHPNWGGGNGVGSGSGGDPKMDAHTPDSSLESALVIDDGMSNHHHHHHHQHHQQQQKMNNSYHDDVSPTRMFGDTIMYRQSKQFRHISGGGPKPGPPPTLPAPVPQPVVPPYSKNHQLSASHSFSSSGGPPPIDKRRSGPATMNLSKPKSGKMKSGRDGVTNASLHSSNDSGFANEPPPQPEVDYSDEETVTRVPIRSSRHDQQNMHQTNRNSQMHTLQRRSNDDEMVTLRKSKSSTDNTKIRQSSSYGNLTDDNTIEFVYRTNDRRSIGKNVTNDDSALDDSQTAKRTKSFWKFGKSDDDILEGMALWQHRDLVQTENERNLEKKKEATLKRNNRKRDSNGSGGNGIISSGIRTLENVNHTSKNSQNGNLSHSNSTSSSETIKNNHPTKIIDEPSLIKYPITKSDIDHRISKHNEENIYGVSQPTPKSQPKMQSRHSQNYMESENDERAVNVKSRRSREEITEKVYRNHHHNQNMNDYYDESHHENIDDDMSLLNNNSIRMPETNFYDDESIDDDIMMMKTVKRKEILKQYYSSGTDTEHHSSSSDPYDCIVVDDHLVRKNEANRKNLNNNNINLNNNNKVHDKMEFTTFRGHGDIKDQQQDKHPPPPRATQTLLPRTKLAKTTSGGDHHRSGGGGQKQMDKDSHDDHQMDTQKRNGKLRNSSNNSNNNNNINLANSKSYGPWYDLWGNDASVKNK